MAYYLKSAKDNSQYPRNIIVATALYGTDGIFRCFGAALLVRGQEIPVDIWWSDNPRRFIETIINHELPMRDTLIVLSEAYRFITDCGFWQAVQENALILTGLDERDLRNPKVVVCDPPTILHYSLPDREGVRTVCDTRNWGWTMPLSPNGECPIKPLDGTESSGQIVGKLYVAVNAMVNFVNDYWRILEKGGLGRSWKFTAGSQAMHAYRSNWMSESIECTIDRTEQDFLAQSIYGGRCECFRLGEVGGPVYHLDFNQLYSYAASMTALPVEMIEHCDNPDDSVCQSAMFDCAALVTLNCNVPCYPYRATGEDSKNGQKRTIYPTGQFRTYLAGPELELARGCGHILQVHELYRYRLSHVFREWAYGMWKLRKNAPPHMSKVVKSIALGLYGKMIQRKRDWIATPGDVPPAGLEIGDWYTQDFSGDVERHRLIDGVCQREVIGEFGFNTAPAIGSWIMSMGRVILWSRILTAANVYYTDTDSIWTDREGFQELMKAGFIGTDLGQLKIEGEYDRAHFWNVKHYWCEAKECHAGVPERAEKRGARKWTWKERQTFQGHMGHQEYPHSREVRKNFQAKAEYRLGVVKADGEVVPFHLTSKGG